MAAGIKTTKIFEHFVSKIENTYGNTRTVEKAAQISILFQSTLMKNS